VPTSKRPQIDDVQYPRVSNRILKGALNEEVVDYVVAEVVMSRAVADEAKDLLVLNLWTV
jgi:hypothetical protein